MPGALILYLLTLKEVDLVWPNLKVLYYPKLDTANHFLPGRATAGHPVRDRFSGGVIWRTMDLG